MENKWKKSAEKKQELSFDVIFSFSFTSVSHYSIISFVLLLFHFMPFRFNHFTCAELCVHLFFLVFSHSLFVALVKTNEVNYDNWGKKRRRRTTVSVRRKANRTSKVEMIRWKLVDNFNVFLNRSAVKKHKLTSNLLWVFCVRWGVFLFDCIWIIRAYSTWLQF